MIYFEHYPLFSPENETRITTLLEEEEEEEELELPTMLFLVLSGLLMPAVMADITGTNPAAGSCICLAFTGVNVRDAGTLSRV